jgi:hypothetical protein
MYNTSVFNDATVTAFISNTFIEPKRMDELIVVWRYTNSHR